MTASPFPSFVAELPQSVLADARSREDRCAHSLRVQQLNDFPCAVKHLPDHVFASVSGGTCSICMGEKAATCTHAKIKFNSTTNSKRRVHTMLFWRHHLGPTFPISDELLRDGVWKQLESCEHGIKRTNGHAKSSGRVCINPAHYTPVTYDAVLDPLIEHITSLGIYPGFDRAVALVSLRLVLGAKDTFLALCDLLQDHVQVVPGTFATPHHLQPPNMDSLSLTPPHSASTSPGSHDEDLGATEDKQLVMRHRKNYRRHYTTPLHHVGL